MFLQNKQSLFLHTESGVFSDFQTLTAQALSQLGAERGEGYEGLITKSWQVSLGADCDGPTEVKQSTPKVTKNYPEFLRSTA